MNKTRKRREKKCAIPECLNLAALKGHCHSHYTTRVYRQRPEYKARTRDINSGITARFNRNTFYCRRHGIDWTIGKEEYAALLANGCHYCGVSLAKETGRGLDRIDNLKGYIQGNVLPSCGRCNRVRGFWFTPEEVKFMMTALAAWKSKT